jgi:hypothetical protein
MLRLVSRIRNRTLEELDQVFSELIRITQTEFMNQQAGSSSTPLSRTVPYIHQSSTDTENGVTQHRFSHQKFARDFDQTADKDMIESRSVESVRSSASDSDLAYIHSA